MNAIYLAGLLVGIAGTLVIDARLRLFFWADARRAAVVLVLGVAGFLLWDTAGVRLGIFFEGNRNLLLGVDIAPEVPVEEVFLLVLLCTMTMNAWGMVCRVLTRRTIRTSRTARAPRPDRMRTG